MLCGLSTVSHLYPSMEIDVEVSWGFGTPSCPSSFFSLWPISSIFSFLSYFSLHGSILVLANPYPGKSGWQNSDILLRRLGTILFLIVHK